MSTKLKEVSGAHIISDSLTRELIRNIEKAHKLIADNPTAQEYLDKAWNLIWDAVKINPERGKNEAK